MKAKNPKIKNKMPLIFKISSILLLMLFSLLTAKTNAQYLFQVTGTSDLSSVNSGSQFIYTINYSTAGNTTSGQNVVATVALPNNVEPFDKVTFSNSISYPSSQVTAATYNAGTNTVTITYINPLPAGATGQIQIKFKYLNGTTPNNYAPNLFTKVTFSNIGSTSPVYSDTTNVIALASNNFTVGKVKNAGGAINDLTIYKLNISSTASSTGSLTLTNPTLVDTLAAGVVFVEATAFSGSNAPVYNSTNRTVTWTWTSGTFATNYSGSAYLSVIHPTGTFSIGNTVCNSATLTGNIPVLPIGNTASSNKNGSVCFGIATPTPNAICTGGGISAATASWLNKHVLSGTTGNTFANGWSNTGNTQLDSVSLTYTIDKSVDVSVIKIGKLVDGLARTSRDTVQLRYKTNLNSTYTLKGTYIITADLNVTITLPVGEYLTQVNFVIYGDLPIGGSQDLTYSGAVRSTALAAKDGSAIVEGTTYITSNPGDDGTTITNNSTGRFVYNGVSTNYSNCAGVAEILKPQPVFNTPNKTITNSSSSFRASDTISYRFSVQLGGNVNAANVVIVDTLDARLNYIAGTGSIVISSVTYLPTVSGNILTWTLGTLPVGTTYTINFKAEIKPGTLANTIPNKIYISSSNALFPRGVTANVTATVITNIALVAYKGQNGCDPAFVYYPINATTQEGGLINYKITVKNQGNIGAKDLTLIDVFPFIGDNRSSQWFANLVGPVTLTDPTATLYYNTVSNPCYVDFTPSVNPPSCNTPVWSLTPPVDITSVKSIKITRSTVLPALDSIVFSWPMRVPVGTPSNIVMNNTIYYQVSRADMAGTTGRLLPAAPNQVGMVTSCAPVLGSLGNYAWIDVNKNGLQDEAASFGINGVKVYLYGAGANNAIGGGDDVLLDSTFTANNFTGNPGYYKFVELVSGKYYVKFETSYNNYLLTPVTIQTNKVDNNNDADNAGLSELVTINTSLTGQDKDNTTIDAGYYPIGSLGNYVWNDDNKNGLQDEPTANGINGQKVYLYREISSVYTVIDSTVTANDGSGNPGYYNFVIYDNGNYKVLFPTSVGTKILTTQTATAGVNGNSDANAITGFSSVIVMNLYGSGVDKNNPTIDAGYICNITATISNKTDALCFGNANGTAIVVGSNGTLPYTYLWSNSATTSSISGLASGTYSVTVTDGLGCTETASTTINQPAVLAVTLTGTDGTCSNNNLGSISTNVTGGTSGYNYLWNNNETTNNLSAIAVAGNYSVTVTDNNGCSVIGNTVAIAITPCCNVTDGGVINGNENGCGSYDASEIGSSNLPTGGVGAIEYVWLYNLTNVPNNNGSNGWVMIAGANGPTYNPGVITQTTYYLRCARRVGCNAFAGESNIIIKTVNPLPNASFTVNNPVQCGINSFVFTNASSNNLTNNWNFGDNTNATTLDATKSYTTTGYFDVKLVVTNSYGCQDSLSKQVFVGNPTASFTYVKKCNGLVEFTNTSINATDYEWIFGNGSVCTSSTENITRKFISSDMNGTNYMVSLIAKNNGICTDTMTQMITIFPNPMSIFSANVIGCTKTVNFKNFSFHATDYSWDFGVNSLTNDTSNLSNPSYTYAANGTYQVTLIAKNAESCGDTLVKTVVVNSNGILPTASFTTTNISSSCANSYAFTNTSTNAVSYQWIFADGSIVNTLNTNKSFGAIGSYVVKLVAESSTGCFDTTTQTINVTTTVTGAVAGFGVNNRKQCLANNSFEFYNTSAFIGSGWIPTYNWDFGDGTTNNVNSSIFNKNFANPGIYTVRLIATGSNYCKDTTYQTVEVLPSPVANFTASTSCGMIAQINNQTSGAIANIWSFGDGVFEQNNNSSFTHTYRQEDWYYITLTAIGANGCKSTTDRGVLPTRAGTPIPNFSYDTLACSRAIKFNNLTTGGAEVKWDFGDGSALSSDFFPTHVYNASGTYNVVLIVSNGPFCSATYNAIVNAPQGQNIATPKAKLVYNIAACSNTISAYDSSENSTIRNWYFDGVLLSVLPTISITNPTVGGHELKLIVSNGTCYDTIKQFILIQPTPVSTFTYQLSTCSRTVLFNSEASNGHTYNWKFNDAGTAIDTAIGSLVSHTFSTNGDYIVQLNTTNLTGCTTTFTDTISVNASSNTLNAAFKFKNTTCNCVCNNKISFTNLTVGNANSYLWNFGDGNSSTQENPAKGYAASGYYNATLTVSNASGCISVASAQVYVPTGSKGPSASFNTDNQVQCLSGNNFSFYNTSGYMGSGWNTKYYWNFGDGTFDTTNTFIFNKHYTAVGVYTVTLVALGSDNCKDTMTMTVQVKNTNCLIYSNNVQLFTISNSNIFAASGNTNTGVTEKTIDNNTWNLYPNPNTGTFNISCKKLSSNVQIEVVDILGRKVNANITKNYADKLIEISCNNISTGNYFVIISNEKEGGNTRLKFNITE